MLVTGTDTGVGKTIVTAAIAAAADGLRVAVLKPAQTGADSDTGTVQRLAGPLTTRTLVSYPDPLAPLAAARVSGLPPLTLDATLAAVSHLRAAHDLVLVEGAGGLLVPLGEGWTAADLAMQLACPAVVVARAGLGTLNHTALTLEALMRRHITAYVAIGSWPARPELVHRTNLDDLPGQRIAIVPANVGRWPAKRFRAAAPGWFTAEFASLLSSG
jgi:dethiobiotin synthetase